LITIIIFTHKDTEYLALKDSIKGVLSKIIFIPFNYFIIRKIFFPRIYTFHHKIRFLTSTKPTINYGGIYMDTDVEIIKNIDVFLDNNAFSSFENNNYIPTN